MGSFQQPERRALFRWPAVVIFFLVFALAGWLYEEALFFYYRQPLENRGFLFGPWLPIYGFGAFITLSTICRFMPRRFRLGGRPLGPLIVFIGVTLMATAIELVAGLVLIHGLGLDLWDYSAHPFQFLGIICLDASLRFGAGGLLFYYGLLPLTERIINRLGRHRLNYVSVGIVALLTMDFIFSLLRHF